MKTTLLILLFTFSVFEGMSQAIRITVQEKTKDGIKPLADTKFELTLNDSLKTELTSGTDGMLGKVPVEPGTYRLILTNPRFEPSETKDIIVSAKKLTAITVTCIAAHENKGDDKKKTPSK
ncbi:MAG: hypothetical protein ACXVNQ_04990 [Bacteroidia bacterium]